jgi:hypothetical protein
MGDNLPGTLPTEVKPTHLWDSGGREIRTQAPKLCNHTDQKTKTWAKSKFSKVMF